MTERVSVPYGVLESPLREWSYNPALNFDGSLVAYDSDASDLVPDDTNAAADVFIRDRTRSSTERISVSSTSVQANGASYDPSVSASARFIAFVSNASNFHPADAATDFDVYVRDRLRGETTWVSVTSTGLRLEGESYDPAISPDGRYIAFTNLSASGMRVYRRDLVRHTTSLVSVLYPGVGHPDSSDSPAISRDGRFVVFTSTAPILSPSPTQEYQIYVRDMITTRTEIVSLSVDGAMTNDYTYGSSISWDGRFVAFTSWDGNLVPGDTNRCQQGTDPSNIRSCPDVFLRDRHTRTTSLISTGLNGIGTHRSDAPVLSADGRTVAFDSYATNFVEGDSNGLTDIYVKNLSTGAIVMASLTTGGRQGIDNSMDSAISGDGRHVGFQSTAPLLVAGDVNGLDVFVHDLHEFSCPQGTTERGPASSIVHDFIELEPIAPAVHGLNCSVIVSEGL